MQLLYRARVQAHIGLNMHMRGDDSKSVLCCARIRQDSEGRYCIEAQSGAEVPFISVDKLSLKLQDVPSHVVGTHISDGTPDNCLVPIYLEQLHPHMMIAGKEALLRIRLTQLSDGCVLGISFSHMLAGAVATEQGIFACESA